MVDAVLQYVGIPASRAAGTKGGWVFNNTIKAHVEAVASGKMGFGAWVASVVKPFALKIPESPWKRTLRDETEAQRQRPIDIENTARRVRETARKWGLPWSEAMVQKWGREIVEGTKSDKDLLDTMEALARGVFPGLPEGVDTETFAAQYTDSYRQILEKEGSVFTPEVQRALRAGKTVMDFERELTMTPEWQGTKNADQRAHALLGQVGELFGYVENG